MCLFGPEWSSGSLSVSLNRAFLLIPFLHLPLDIIMIAFSLISILLFLLLLSMFFFHWNVFQCVNRCLGWFYCFSLTCPTPFMRCKGLRMGCVDTANDVAAGSIQRKAGWEGGMLGCWTMLWMLLFFNTVKGHFAALWTYYIHRWWWWWWWWWWWQWWYCYYHKSMV